MDQQTETTPAAAPRPPFKVSGNASIKHLNVRKEGPEDEKILAVDVKLEIKNIDRRLCAYFDDALEAFLWRGEANALIVRNQFMAPVVYSNEISSANVHIGGEFFTGCDVKKFGLQPHDGGVMTLTCSVALYPSAQDVSELAKLVQDEANVSIEGPPDLFAADPVPAAAHAPASGTLQLESDRDELYAQAEILVRAENRASISMVQRHLQIGYNRAARIMEQLQDGGVVSPQDAMGTRHVKPVTTPTGEQQ